SGQTVGGQRVQHWEREPVGWGIGGVCVDDVQHGPQVPLARRHRDGHRDPLLRCSTPGNPARVPWTYAERRMALDQPGGSSWPLDRPTIADLRGIVMSRIQSIRRLAGFVAGLAT